MKNKLNDVSVRFFVFVSLYLFDLQNIFAGLPPAPSEDIMSGGRDEIDIGISMFDRIKPILVAGAGLFVVLVSAMVCINALSESRKRNDYGHFGKTVAASLVGAGIGVGLVYFASQYGS